LYGVFFGQLIVAVLGVLVISGEYSTGMIRSSFAAVPRRTPVFVAKSIVLFASSFVVGTVSAVTGYAIAEPALSAKGFPVDITQADTVWAILGAGAYLGLVSVFALGLGALLRSAAGGIAAALGIVFLLPIIVTILRNQMSTVEWIGEVPQYLISNAGEAMAGSSLTTLGPWQNVLVVVVWTAVSFFAGATIMKRRDA
jgi:ABC-2 type transport system permease protein